MGRRLSMFLLSYRSKMGGHTMKLITVEINVAAEAVETAVALLEGLRKHAVAMLGCESYNVYRAGSNEGAVAVIQRWNDMVSFDAYRASEAFASLGKHLRPMLTAPPVTTIAEVTV
jgi:quinol monooxygenase YgiN